MIKLKTIASNNRNLVTTACLTLLFTVSAYAQIGGIGGDPLATTAQRVGAWITGATGKTVTLILAFLFLFNYAKGHANGQDRTWSTVLGISGLASIQFFWTYWFQ